MALENSTVARVTRSKAQAQSAYDRMSGWYGLITDPFEGVYRRRGLAWLSPEPRERLLEIGCGPGQALADMAEKCGHSGRIHGLDISGGMLRRAGLRLKKARASETVALLQGDGASLPYRNDSFDAIFLSFTLELFDSPEIPRVLAECRRVSKPQGRMVTVSMAKQHSTNLMTRLYSWFRRLFPQYADCRAIWAQQDLESAGFHTLERVDFSMFGLPGAIILARAPS